MKRVSYALLIVLLAVSSGHAGVIRVLSWDRSGVTAELVIPEPAVTELDEGGPPHLARISVPGFFPVEFEGRPVLPSRRFIFAVPSEGGVQLDVIDLDVQPLGGVVPVVHSAEPLPFDRQREAIRADAAGAQPQFVRLADVGVFRRTNVAMVDCSPIVLDRSGEGLLVLKRIVIRLSFPPAAEAARGRRLDPELASLIVNAEQAARWGGTQPRLRLAQRTPFEFAQSDNWVRIRVSEAGLHLVTYNDLLIAGVNPGTIDAATMRLFAASPLQQPDSLSGGGSFEDSYHMVEQAIHYRGSPFWEGDSIIFYGVGIEGWMNVLDPAADAAARYENLYEREHTYWLTWGGAFSGEPRRMEERSVAPGGASPDISVTTYEDRLHVENDTQYDPIYAQDRWYWLRMNIGGSSSFSHSFTLSDLPQGAERGRGRLVTIGCGPYVSNHNNNSARYYINGSIVDTLRWVVYGGNFLPVYLDRELTNLVEGKNTFLIQKSVSDAAYLLWYDIFYRRTLKARSGALDFFAPAGVGTARFTMSGFATGQKLLFDVTDKDAPVLLTGAQGAAGGVVFDDELDGSPRHYAAAAAGSLRRPSLELAGTAAERMPSLRDDPVCPDMLIIYHERFRNAALALRDHRAAHLPYAPRRVVKAVDIQHVYDNFSGGNKDPLAIRNYCKFLYDHFADGGSDELRYVLLIGNGTYDPKDLREVGTDLIPFFNNVEYNYYNESIEDDDFLVKLDDGIDRYPDLAIGRLTVLTVQEANRWVERIIEYETNPQYGAWKNEVVLVADDEYSSNTNTDFLFLFDAEGMAARGGVFPRFTDFAKIYLFFFPFEGGAKPAARDALINVWNDGALIVNYAGHGSELQMADELVMVKSDVFSLTNGNLRPLYLAFSCHVGDLQEPTKRSLAQDLVTYEEGGAIASISGTTFTSGPGNSTLNYVFFQCLFTSRDSTGTEPIGIALLHSKIADATAGLWRNNAMYLLLGDPAFTLAFPAYTVEHDAAAIDTMLTGRRYRVDGTVREGGTVMTSFDGTAEIVVQEAEKKVDTYVYRDGIRCHVKYVLTGNEIFRGTVDVTAGRFSTDFVVPLRCRTGPNARIRSYVRGGGMDGVGADDELLIVPASTIPPNEAPPTIHMYFAGQATQVKPGAKLIADLYDSDGIALLGTEPQSSIFLEFDRSGYPIYVTDYFEYDHGSSTSGQIQYPLHAGFSPGEHMVVLRAFDNLGKSSSDTLRFEIIEEGRYLVSDVFAMPNPFSETTNFIFQTSDRARVRLCVYNLSGILVWERRMSVEEGFNSIYWNGRDLAGDRLANGTYLYVLEVEFAESFHRAETVTGKVVLLE